MDKAALKERAQLVEKVIEAYGAKLVGEKFNKNVWFLNDGFYSVDTINMEDGPYIVIEYGKSFDEGFEDIDPFPVDAAMKVFYEAIRDSLEIQYPVVLTDDEIERVLLFANNMERPISLPEIAARLSKIGFPELEKQIESIEKPDKNLDAETNKRGDCVFHCIDIKGQVSYNEEGLACPRCGSRYVAWRQFYSYLSEKPKEDSRNRKKREEHRLEGASNVCNKSYYNCLACNFEFV